MAQQMDDHTAMLLFEQAPVGIITLEAGKIRSINQQTQQLIGLNPDTVCGQSVTILPEWLAAIVTKQDDIDTESGELCLNVHVSLRQLDSLKICYLFDITEKKRLEQRVDELEQQLESLETRDRASRLLNQNGVMQALETQVARTRRYGNDLSIMSMKIAAGSYAAEQQKEVYESLGYLFNDRLRWVDSVGHIAQDEFLIILPETNADAASALKNKLFKELAEFTLHDSDTPMTLSVTIGAVSWQDGDDARQFLARAQSARG